MESKLLRALYDCFYTRPRFDEQENEVEECHKALIEVLAKPERKLVLRIIDAQDYIKTETSLDSFIAGFELAWRLSAEMCIRDRCTIPWWRRGKNQNKTSQRWKY